jgi:hypothetical protein
VEITPAQLGPLAPTGLLRLDAAAVAADAKLDGKYLLRTSDPHLSTEDIALGYKQLLEVECGWRDMKQVLDLRPVFHRLEDRIRAMSCSAGSPCYSPGSSKAAPTPHGPAPATSCNACTWGPSPARPGCSARPATPATRPAGCTPHWTSRSRPGSSTLTPSSPQHPDQA